jgi:poly(A) polymerase
MLFEHLLWINWAEQPSADALRYQLLLTLCLDWQIPVCPVRASDVISLGVPPGKRLGLLLKEIEVFWEQEEYKPSKEQLLEFIRSSIDRTL